MKKQKFLIIFISITLSVVLILGVLIFQINKLSSQEEFIANQEHMNQAFENINLSTRATLPNACTTYEKGLFKARIVYSIMSTDFPYENYLDDFVWKKDAHFTEIMVAEYGEEYGMYKYVGETFYTQSNGMHLVINICCNFPYSFASKDLWIFVVEEINHASYIASVAVPILDN